MKLELDKTYNMTVLVVNKHYNSGNDCDVFYKMKVQDIKEHSDPQYTVYKLWFDRFSDETRTNEVGSLLLTMTQEEFNRQLSVWGVKPIKEDVLTDDLFTI